MIGDPLTITAIWTHQSDSGNQRIHYMLNGRHLYVDHTFDGKRNGLWQMLADRLPEARPAVPTERQLEWQRLVTS